MAGELEKALSEKLGSYSTQDELMRSMCQLLILLLKKISDKEELKDEDDLLMEGMRDRITGKRKFSSLANTLIPKPM